jgi:Tfp pilus assembly protein PilX
MIGRRRQGGAAALIMVMLLFVFVAVILAWALTMATSETWDSYGGGESRKAFFLAESGLERAAWRFANATACADLATDGPYALGGGSFTVNGAIAKDFDGTTDLESGRCRIQASGTVGLSTRTVQAVIARTGGAGGGVVIDYGFDEPNRWDDGEHVVSGGVADFTKDERKIKAEKKDVGDPENGIAEITPAPGSVPLTLSFDYVVSGTVWFQFKIKFGGGGTIVHNTPDLTGSGTYTISLGAGDPNDIEEFEIEVKNISVGETAQMDNVYLGPTSGAGGGGVALMRWREVVSP